MLTINLFLSPASVKLGLARSAESIADLQNEIKTNICLDHNNPLAIWSEEIEAMSLIPKTEMAEPYTMLLKDLDSK